MRWAWLIKRKFLLIHSDTGVAFVAVAIHILSLNTEHIIARWCNQFSDGPGCATEEQGFAILTTERFAQFGVIAIEFNDLVGDGEAITFARCDCTWRTGTIRAGEANDFDEFAILEEESGRS